MDLIAYFSSRYTLLTARPYNPDTAEGAMVVFSPCDGVEAHVVEDGDGYEWEVIYYLNGEEEGCHGDYSVCLSEVHQSVLDHANPWSPT